MTRAQDGTHAPVAVVTGGGSGIGQATVLRLLDGGHRVLIADLNEKSNAATVALAAEAGHGDRVLAVGADVRSENDIAAMLGTAVNQYGRLDVLVNNAGVGGAFGPVTDVAAEDWDFTFDVLVRGVFLGIKHAVPHMADGAAIVNVASAAAWSGNTAGMAYAAAKAAVISITRSAAVELAPRSIRVNAVCPGVIRTPLLEAGRAEELDRILPPGQPLPRWGQPGEVAAAIEFLAGPGASFITGETLLIDGGLVAAGPGPTFLEGLGTDPRSRGLAGVNRGSTGERSVVRKRP
jgi:NAD(P)-dependent dehydrogenase (short-subunit alcohol dehydrogenase family)